jgi:flagellar biosynthetic protein FlhB
LAEKIKEVAREHNIPVMENKPLARALFKSTAVGQAVPSSLFGAVAELLAFVYQVQGTLARKASENRARLREAGHLPAKNVNLGDATA